MPTFEIAAGSAIAQVEAYCRHLTNSGTFDTATSPTRTQVTAYLNLAGFEIAGVLVRSGYEVTQIDAEVVGFLQNANAYQAVMSVELSVPTNDVTGEGNARFQEFKRRYQNLIDMISDTDVLDQLGATRTRSASQYLIATGLSRADKETVAEDTDHIPARFQRGLHRAPGIIGPTSSVPGDLADR